MECCSKSDEKIDETGGEGCQMTEGVLHGPTRRDPKICLFFPTFYCCAGSYCKPYHSLAAPLIELTSGGKIF